MSKLQSIQVLEEHQDLVQKLLSQTNKVLNQEHFSFHVNSAERLTHGSDTEYHFRIKSNDGELYKIVVLQHSDDRPAEVLSGNSLYDIIDTLPEHHQRILGYKDTINKTYKAQNSSYQIVSVQQLIDDPSNFVFKVRGSEDNKIYKVKIERPIAAKVNKSPEFITTSKISA